MHIKYRPSSFDEFLGNEQVVEALKVSSLDTPIMFEGEPGVGKTTLAFILSKEFGAPEQNIEHHNCRNMSVDMVRDIIDSLNRPTIYGRRRVLILDELHGLSPSAQEKLLIPLEPPPKDVLVIACTTSLERINKALLRRFIRYKLHPISDDDAIKLIDSVIEAEGLLIPKPVKAVLLEKSHGVPGLLLVNLSIVRACQDEDSARYLLEFSDITSNVDIIDLLKLVLSPAVGWSNLKDRLYKVLNTSAPEEVRIGLMRLLGGRIMSKYFNGSKAESEKLIKLFKLLDSYNNQYTMKANVAFALLEFKISGNS